MCGWLFEALFVLQVTRLWGAIKKDPSTNCISPQNLSTTTTGIDVRDVIYKDKDFVLRQELQKHDIWAVGEPAKEAMSPKEKQKLFDLNKNACLFTNSLSVSI